MKLAVVGSRTITDYEIVKAAINDIWWSNEGKNLTIISGGAKGVDKLAEKYANLFSWDFVLFKPYHLIDFNEPYRPRFFFTRNKQIADNADIVLIIWDGVSHGSTHMIEYCKKKNKAHKVVIIEVEQEEQSDEKSQ